MSSTPHVRDLHSSDRVDTQSIFCLNLCIYKSKNPACPLLGPVLLVPCISKAWNGHDGWPGLAVARTGKWPQLVADKGRGGGGGGGKWMRKRGPDVKERLIPNRQKQTRKEVSNFLLWRCVQAQVQARVQGSVGKAQSAEFSKDSCWRWNYEIPWGRNVQEFQVFPVWKTY